MAVRATWRVLHDVDRGRKLLPVGAGLRLGVAQWPPGRAAFRVM